MIMWIMCMYQLLAIYLCSFSTCCDSLTETVVWAILHTAEPELRVSPPNANGSDKL